MPLLPGAMMPAGSSASLTFSASVPLKVWRMAVATECRWTMPVSAANAPSSAAFAKGRPICFKASSLAGTANWNTWTTLTLNQTLAAGAHSLKVWFDVPAGSSADALLEERCRRGIEDRNVDPTREVENRLAAVGRLRRRGGRRSAGSDEVPPFRVENTYFKQFPLRYEMQLSDLEIAESLRVPIGTAKSTLHRALALRGECRPAAVRGLEPARPALLLRASPVMVAFWRLVFL